MLIHILIPMVALLAAGTAHAQSTGRQPARTLLPQATTVDQCVARGIAYFREIGSYPQLTAPPNRGRDAVEVANERCRRTVGAWNGMDLYSTP